jgi:AraC-like DNA-binding protein
MRVTTAIVRIQCLRTLFRRKQCDVIFPTQSAANLPNLCGGAVGMTTEATWQVLPTVTGFAAKQALAALRKNNIAAAPLLKRAGLSEHDLAPGNSDPMRYRVSAVGQGRFLDYAAEAIDDGAFGLHLAEQTNPRDAGILFYVASGAKNLKEALTLFGRYFRIVNEAVHLKLVQTLEGIVVEFKFVGLPRHSARQNAEFGISIILKALREMAGRLIRPARVVFLHPRNSNLREFERFYGCPVEFGYAPIKSMSSDLLEFSNDVLTTPLITADACLIEALQPFCNDAAKKRGTAAGTLRAGVESEVEKLLPQGKAKAQAVAKAMGLSVRTLSRRLANEGTTFAGVVDQLRRSLALQYIKESGMSVSQIAWLLGYEGSTSFNHAFRRWTGRSPSDARSEKQLLD